MRAQPHDGRCPTATRGLWALPGDDGTGGPTDMAHLLDKPAGATGFIRIRNVDGHVARRFSTADDVRKATGPGIRPGAGGLHRSPVGRPDRILVPGDGIAVTARCRRGHMARDDPDSSR